MGSNCMGRRSLRVFYPVFVIIEHFWRTQTFCIILDVRFALENVGDIIYRSMGYGRRDIFDPPGV